MSDTNSAFSLGRLLKVLLPIALIAVAVNYSLPGLEKSLEKAAQVDLEENMLDRLLGEQTQEPTEKIDFADTDGDLVADAPAEGVTPERLVFSYIADPKQTDEAETWADVMAAIAEATGLPVDYIHFTTTSEQLAAMARGELHITGLNTGAVPTAVKSAGFVPVCTLGHDDGSFGYTMQMITRSDSPIDSPEQVRKMNYDKKAAAKEGEKTKAQRFVFTRPDSNSGFKAAFILLMTDYGLEPERDYQWGFSFDHEVSIHEAIASEGDLPPIAPVASDILQRMTGDGDINAESYKVIYESERFPPASLGHAHNLNADLRDKIAQALLDFDWSGTSVAAKYASSGVSKFVPVSYKDDWANIRRIDDAVREAKASK